MGKNVKIFPGVSIGSEPYLISIGDDVEITDGVRLLTHDGGIKVAMRMGLCKSADLMGRIEIGNNVFIGVNAIILPHVKIGDNVIIGAGSIVAHDIPSNCVAAGVPARVLSTVEEFFDKNKMRVFKTDDLNPQQKKEFYQTLEYNKLL